MTGRAALEAAREAAARDLITAAYAWRSDPGRRASRLLARAVDTHVATVAALAARAETGASA